MPIEDSILLMEHGIQKEARYVKKKGKKLLSYVALL